MSFFSGSSGTQKKALHARVSHLTAIKRLLLTHNHEESQYNTVSTDRLTGELISFCLVKNTTASHHQAFIMAETLSVLSH